MILFTGRGELFDAFRQKYDCAVISARKATDDELGQAFKKADTIIHNAADLVCKDLTTAISNNFGLTQRILDTLQNVNPDAKFIFTGSMSYLKNEFEYADWRGMTLYAYSKFLAESYCLRYPSDKIKSVRFSTLFCKNPEKDGLSGMICNAVSSNKITLINQGKAYRNFIPLEIATDYLYKLALSDFSRIESKTINIVGKKYSFEELAGCLKRLNPSLDIKNIEMENTPEILSDFSDKYTSLLGIIDFNIYNHIEDYYYKLGGQ